MNVNSLGEDMLKLDLFSISTHDYYDDETKIEVRSSWTNDIKLYTDENVTVVTTYDGEDSFGNRNPNRFSDVVTVIECDNIEKTFSFIADKYKMLEFSSMNTTITDNVLYLNFQFSSWHYFRSWDSFGITLYVTYPTSTGSSVIVFEGCEFVSETEVKWLYNAGNPNIDDFMCSVFRNDTYEMVGVAEDGEVDEKYVEVDVIPETACFTDELYLKKRVVYRKDPLCEKWNLYEKKCNDGTLLGVTIKRDNFKYQDVNETEEYVDIPLTSINVPISLKCGYDLYQEQNINDKFVSEEVIKNKNSSPEMEKNIYHPVFKTQDGYHVINKIKFNLHFREREREGWVVKSEGYWNGMGENGDFLANVGAVGNKQYFSYANKGRQSDLLTYLGFTDLDVKYQKSKLKQSFLRLSFFDAPNRANQNLLCYSTVFMDSGKLFNKMVRGSGRKKMFIISQQTTNLKYDDIKVDREPYFNGLGYTDYTDEDVETFRLSSQIVVSDRQSDSCSEGFYLYLWTDEDNGKIPSDIYMRVEFNHAGYGRVIPFTMPFAMGNPYSERDTFTYVQQRWTQNNGWDVITNEKYSYIHFKYVYDEESKQHVYYLDPDTYGLNTYLDETPTELELDLYEPKINFE